MKKTKIIIIIVMINNQDKINQTKTEFYNDKTKKNLDIIKTILKRRKKKL